VEGLDRRDPLLWPPCISCKLLKVCQQSQTASGKSDYPGESSQLCREHCLLPEGCLTSMALGHPSALREPSWEVGRIVVRPYEESSGPIDATSGECYTLGKYLGH